MLLFLHGNSGNVSTNLPQAVRFVRLGFSVLMVDYRGYGISAGEQPSERRVYEDAEAAYRFLLDEGIAPRDIFIYGHSLGGAVAIELASRIKNAAGPILESTFTSLTDVARMRFPFLPAERILQHRFDSLAKARSLTLPVMVVHGTADETIPFEMAERLFAAIASTRKKLLLIANGGHSSSGAVETLRYFNAIKEFVAAAG